MSGIDYSKWDKMDFSDDDDSTSSTSEKAPRVTRLDKPSQITLSSKGIEVKDKAKISKAEKPQIASRMKRMTKNGGTFVDPVTMNQICWSQDREEAALHIFYDQSIASKDIRVHLVGALKYEDRYSAVGSQEYKGTLKVSAMGRDTILEGDLEYSTYIAENEILVDFEIDVSDPSAKFIKITLLKAVPMQGLSIWWKRPLAQFPAIDVVSDIDGRNKQEQWKKSWEEAHRIFSNKKKETHKI